jgi:hypothetical protein
MRSTFRTSIPNMRGKKVYRFRCQCCEAQDFRDREDDRLARELMRHALRGRLARHLLHQAEIDAIMQDD